MLQLLWESLVEMRRGPKNRHRGGRRESLGICGLRGGDSQSRRPVYSGSNHAFAKWTVPSEGKPVSIFRGKEPRRRCSGSRKGDDGYADARDSRRRSIGRASRKSLKYGIILDAEFFAFSNKTFRRSVRATRRFLAKIIARLLRTESGSRRRRRTRNLRTPRDFEIYGTTIRSTSSKNFVVSEPTCTGKRSEWE